MSIRQVVKTLAVSGAATLCGTALVLGLGAGAAGAGQVSNPTLTNGPTTLTANGSTTVAAGTPYSSGQAITVSGSANSTLNAANLSANDIGAGNYYIIECADPGGTTANLPTQTNQCEGGTEDGLSSPHSSDGSFSDSGYQVYVLPDSLFSPTTFTGTVGVAPNYGVIGIFAADPFTSGFTSANPHLWSAPFQVQPSTGVADSGGNPGDGTPEVPLAIGLPLAGLAAFGAWTVRSRRRRTAEQRVA
jgi:hypothetical protein